ncbi:uncharacterized protein LOC121981716 isoform X2 [Zingiber officinale]|uniref:uncharacterized protein LOC121981716 isoform X2 n=1 Tax=Zingiber officinale TaxID=94328 RepID=UPI001C4C60C2|nr:uncharacterized protein LOC121981716 isoform X2 [Zingiber officinale]
MGGIGKIKFTNELVWEESSFGLNVYSLLSGVNGEMLTNEEVSDLKLYSREHLVAIDPKFERHHLYDQWMSHTIEYPQQEARKLLLESVLEDDDSCLYLSEDDVPPEEPVIKAIYKIFIYDQLYAEQIRKDGDNTFKTELLVILQPHSWSTI